MTIARIIEGDSKQGIPDEVILKCDIIGEEFPAAHGWYGTDEVHICDTAMEMLVIEWIAHFRDKPGYPLALHKLIECFTHPKRPYRYVSKRLQKEVLKKYKQECLACGDTESLEYDHIRPVSKGGISELENLQLLCKKCNRIKGDKYPFEIEDIRNAIHQNN